MSLRRAAFATAAALALSLAAPRLASAHTFLLASDPVDGARLTSSPRLARLEFDQPISMSLSGVELHGARSGRIEGVDALSLSGSTLVVVLPKLEHDSYLLSWHAVSADDLHPSGGAVAFVVGAGGVVGAQAVPPAPPTVVVGPAGKEIAFRWLDFGALAGLVGALTLALVCVPRARRRGAQGIDPLERRLLGVAALSGTIALWTGSGLLLVQVKAIARDESAGLVSVVARTHYGNAWIAREICVALLLAGAFLTARRGRRRWQSVATLAVMPLLALALSANSHSAAARGVMSVATCALALHVLAAAVWAGGVGALALAFAGRYGTLRARGSILLLQSFGSVAVLGVAVLVITGVYTTGVDIASPDALVTTLYGRTLLVKSGVFAALVLVGLGNALLLHSGRGGRAWLARGLRAEAVLMLAILLPVAVLLSTAPARGPRVDARPLARAPSAGQLRSLDAGDLIVSLSMKPNAPGTNVVSADVIDTRRPAPAPLRAVEFAVARPGRDTAWREAARLSGTTWQVSDARLPSAGRWTVSLRIRRDSLPDQVVRTSWSVPAATTLASAASTRSLSPLTSRLAVLVAAVFAVAGVAVAVRRTRSRDVTQPSPATDDTAARERRMTTA